jgi:hypothetical protein
MLVNPGGGYISISIPDNDELTPLSVAMVSSTAFLRWSKGDTRVATYASAVDENRDLGDQVWDLDADGRFDQIKTPAGEELWYLDNRWVKIVQRVESDEGTLFDLVVTETGQRYRRAGDTWVREPTTSAPGGRNP